MSTSQNFCYLDIRSQPDVIIGCINIGFTIMLFLYSLRAYFRSKMTGGITNQIKIIFLFIFAWEITYTAQFLYGILIYQFKLRNETTNLTRYSKIYAAADAVPYFILEGTFLLIVFNIIKNLETIMNNEYVDYFPNQKQMKFYRRLKYYQFVRLIKIVHCGFLFLQLSVDNLYIIEKIGISLIIADNIICTLLFYIARQVISNKKILKQRMENKDYKKLMNQLLILNIVSLARCFADVIFLLVPLNLQYPQCLDQILWITYGYLFIGQFLIHFVPVFLIVNYYTVPKQYLKKSILSGYRT